MDEKTKEVIIKGLKSCPFCGAEPEFISVPYRGTGASGMEAPRLGLRCSNEHCPVRPATKLVNTEKWDQGVGHYKVDETDMLIKAWEHRSQEEN